MLKRPSVAPFVFQKAKNSRHAAAKNWTKPIISPAVFVILCYQDSTAMKVHVVAVFFKFLSLPLLPLVFTPFFKVCRNMAGPKKPAKPQQSQNNQQSQRSQQSRQRKQQSQRNQQSHWNQQNQQGQRNQETTQDQEGIESNQETKNNYR